MSFFLLVCQPAVACTSIYIYIYISVETFRIFAKMDVFISPFTCKIYICEDSFHGGAAR